MILYDTAIQCELPILEKFAFNRGPQAMDAQSEQLIQYLEETEHIPEDLKLDQLELVRQSKQFKYDLSKLFSPTLDKDFQHMQKYS